MREGESKIERKREREGGRKREREREGGRRREREGYMFMPLEGTFCKVPWYFMYTS